MGGFPDGRPAGGFEYWLRAQSRAVSTGVPDHVVPSYVPQCLPRRLSAIAIGLLASGVALADAHLDPHLVSLMSAAGAADELQIVVSYEQSGPVTAAQTAALQQLGITKGITMRTLPIAGALATPAEIRGLAERADGGAL
jgi:hypothetical protein